MAISAGLRADLAALTAGLDEHVSEVGLDSRLADLLHDFAVDLKLAVASYCGLSMRVDLTDYEVSVALMESGAAASTTSMLLPLSALSPIHGAGALILYASTPGALVDLAADLSVALDVPPEALVLDRHLDDLPVVSGISGLAEHSSVNQAIGVLIDRGHTVVSARAELRRQALLYGFSLQAAAAALLRSI